MNFDIKSNALLKRYIASLAECTIFEIQTAIYLNAYISKTKLISVLNVIGFELSKIYHL